MPTFDDLRIPAALAAALALLACGEKRSDPVAPSPPQPAAIAPAAPAAPEPPAAPPAGAPSAPAAEAKPPDAAKPAAAPKTPDAPKPVVAAKPAPRADPAPPASNHAKVGADKCRMCHRVQHASWAASPHAAKGIDCERCHGNGGDYWPAGVMRDRAKAMAAGLVMPDLPSCKKCHGAKADAALFAKVHAHKAR